MDFTIETYWNVESTYLILNAVASLMGSSDWVGALKFIFLTAIMASLFVFALDRDLGLSLIHIL
ncbi:conjugal transfer protein TraG, partial [Acinetobacter baumannii]|nr:conjugal transfer protein TraG [Acinetobacter baumannii]